MPWSSPSWRRPFPGSSKTDVVRFPRDESYRVRRHSFISDVGGSSGFPLEGCVGASSSVKFQKQVAGAEIDKVFERMKVRKGSELYALCVGRSRRLSEL